MGCFLACFGSSKDQRRRKQRHQIQVQPREQFVQRHASYLPVQSIVSSKQENTEQIPNSVVPEIRDESGEKLSFSSRKKVTFDTNVTTYEHIPVDESIDSLPEAVKRDDKEEGEDLARQSQSQSSSTSSTRSYPPGHRYQNCRDSDDEEEGLDLEEGDVDDEYDDDDLFDDYDEGQDSNDFCEDEDNGYAERRMKNSAACLIMEEVEGPLVDDALLGEEVTQGELEQNARDRSRYVHPVLNPVENITQWKAVKKAKGTHQLKPRKENFNLDQESRVSFSLEPSFKGSRSEHFKKSNHEVAVDASLSNWLVSPETTPNSKANRASADNSKAPWTSMSKGSNSITSLEDRPILGALTVEELKQMSASNSPRKSPSRSPDEMPIIGTVGTYWTHTKQIEDSGSASSFKGIPNTTSKYREDKRVNWHSTPFETRLEKALSRGSPEA